jgi:hypothetical protein
MAKFNGHKNWNHWNVSLWINNDENLYRQARSFVRLYGKTAGAVYMLGLLKEWGKDKTPDGAPYSVSSIRAAMVEM